MEKILSKSEYMKIANQIVEGKSINNTKMYQFQHDTEVDTINTIISKYKLAKDQTTDLETAINNYNYEDNDGVIFINADSLWNCFDNPPTDTLKKALAEYIIEHNKIYEQVWNNQAETRAIEYLEGGGIVCQTILRTE